jgi:hypothetical protein
MAFPVTLHAPRNSINTVPFEAELVQLLKRILVTQSNILKPDTSDSFGVQAYPGNILARRHIRMRPYCHKQLATQTELRD